MKTVCIISDMVNNTPTTKIKMYRLTEKFKWLNKTIEKEFQTKKEGLIDYLLWFSSVEEAEQYLEKL